jgi:hypothetical protein
MDIDEPNQQQTRYSVTLEVSQRNFKGNAADHPKGRKVLNFDNVSDFPELLWTFVQPICAREVAVERLTNL